MRLAIRLIAPAGIGVAMVLAACGSDSAPDADVSAEADAGAALEALTDYADDWSIELTDDEVECVVGNLDEEFRSAGGTVSEVAIPLFLLGCGADVSSAAGGDGRPPLETIVAALLVDQSAELTDDVVTCATEALVEGFGADGFAELVVGADEPSADDDAIAEAAFDSCGLDGTAIVDR